MSKKWFSNSYRRWLVDMHIPDWNQNFLSKVNPEHYAEMMTVSGADSVIIYASSCLGICYWPTKFGYVHKQFQERDLLKELISACSERSLDVVVYYNIWSRWAYNAHPEWRIVEANGKGTVENGSRYGLCCPNTGFKEYAINQIVELVESYEFKGLWIDMIGWFSKICYCHECRKRFLDETGKELPHVIDWHNPDWWLFQKERQKWMSDFASSINSTIKDIKPELSIAMQQTSLVHGWGGGINFDFTQQSDYLAGDFGGGNVDESLVCKLLSGLSHERPVEFMIPFCESLAHHTTDKSEEHLLIEAYSAIANQCACVIISAINTDGTLNSNVYTTGGRVFQELKKFEKYLSINTEICADIAIYWSFSSMVDFDCNFRKVKDYKTKFNYYEKIKIIVQTLIEENLPFTIITQKDLKQLDKFKMVILSDVLAMDELELQYFERYVNCGGKIYASGKTSLYNSSGEQQKDFQLNELFGVKYENDSTVENVTYIAPKAPVLGYCEEYPLMLMGQQALIEASDGAEVLGKLVLPCGDFSELEHFGCGNSNPPVIQTSKPAIVSNKFGKGKVIYCAGLLEQQPYSKPKRFWISLISDLLTNPVWISNAPKDIEIMLFYDDMENHYIISVLNYQKTTPPIPVQNIEIQFKPHYAQSGTLLSVDDDESVEFDYIDNGYIKFTIPELNMFKMYVFK